MSALLSSRPTHPQTVAITTLAMSAACYQLGRRELASESTWAVATLVAATAHSEGWSWEQITEDPKGACSLVERLWRKLDGGAS